MSDKNTLRDALRDLTKPAESYYSVVCTVSDVTDETCNCSPVNGDADILDVRLQADVKTGILIKPKDGSIVVVTMLNKHTGFVSMFSEVDSIVLNGDNYDGLVRVNDLTNKLNALINQLTTEHAAIAAGITTAGGSYTPIALTTFNANDYKNTTVKHGNG